MTGIIQKAEIEKGYVVVRVRFLGASNAQGILVVPFWEERMCVSLTHESGLCMI